jgi:hypothetical protein
MFSDLLGSIALSAGMDMAGAFAKASAQASSGPGALWCRFGSTTAKRTGRGISAAAQSKEILKASKNLRPVTEGTIFCAPNDPPACPAWGRVGVPQTPCLFAPADDRNAGDGGIALAG